MNELIKINKKDEATINIEAERSILQELSDFFTFTVPGHKFTPAYKNKMWDGKIRMLSVHDGSLYAGLNEYIDKFAEDRDYKVQYNYDYADTQFSIKEANDFVEKLNPTMKPRDYQLNAFVHAVRKNRTLLLSPTASGKSFIIYLLTSYYAKKTLIIVPTTTLVHQLYSDFQEYGFPSDKFVHKIHGGQDKNTDKLITISTWQSIYKMPRKYFEDFDVVIGDEAHLFKAKSLTSILTKMTNTKYRFGFTGTLDGAYCNKLVLEGLFGKIYKVTTTAELIEKKQLSDFKIKCIILQYDDESKKIVRKGSYQDEMNFLVSNQKRNNFIKNLTLSLEGNTLLLFQYVEKHGKILYDLIKNDNEHVYFVHGGVDGSERDEIRKIVETQNNAIIVASYATFSTGINIKNLHNVIFASPSKSRVRNLQSIGRGLRKGKNKESATLYDIADDLTWKSKENHTKLHFIERLKIYSEEKFEYKIYNVRIE